MRTVLTLVVCAAAACAAPADNWGEEMHETVLLAKNGRYAEAAEKLKELVSAAQRQGSADEPRMAATWNNLASAEEALGNDREAERDYLRSLAIHERQGTATREHARVLNNLGELYTHQRRFSKAEPLLRRSLEMRNRVLEPGDPDIANGLNNLAVLYEREGRLGEAEALFRKTLALWDANPPLDLREQAAGLNNLATVVAMEGRPADAVPPAERSVAISREALGPEHPTTASMEANLAATYINLGRYPEAERLLARALQTTENTLGALHPQTGRICAYYALLFRKTGRKADAARFGARADAILARRASEVPPYVVDAADALAFRGVK